VPSDLLDRRPHLLRALAAQILPPPLPSTDPAKHIGIDLSSLRTVEDVRQVLPEVLAAVAGAETAPGTGCSAWAIGRTACFLRSFAGRDGADSHGFGIRD
jgi:hypothetical protein